MSDQFESQPLSDSETARYIRQIALPELGADGQQKLKNSRVLCIGAGGLGCPATQYLAAAGIGHLGIVDDDVVEASNLQRQILFGDQDIGKRKTQAAFHRIRDLNSSCRVVVHSERFEKTNALRLAAGYDIILDGSDNFETRLVANRAAAELGLPYVYGSVEQFEGQVAVFWPSKDGACYECIFPSASTLQQSGGCEAAGVLGIVPGVIGTMQASETIKLIVGIGSPLIGSLLHIDLLHHRTTKIALKRKQDCEACGSAANRTSTHAQPQKPEGARGAGDNSSLETPDGSLDSSISIAQLRHLLNSTPEQLLCYDLRTAEEFERGSIPSATNKPFTAPGAPLPDIGSDSKTVVLVCRTGTDSRRLARQLRQAGQHRVLSLEGGYLAWQLLS